MNRSRVRSRFWKNPSEENRNAYNRQRNYCVNLIRRKKRKYFDNLNVKDVTDNKIFWNSMKPLFSDKFRVRNEKVILIDNDIISSEGKEVAEIINSFL